MEECREEGWIWGLFLSSVTFVGGFSQFRGTVSGILCPLK